MPIKARIDMLSTGIRTPIGIKVFGNDLAQMEKLATQIEAVVKTVPGTTSAYAERITGGYYLTSSPDRLALARYGLRRRRVAGSDCHRAGRGNGDHHRGGPRSASGSACAIRANCAIRSADASLHRCSCRRPGGAMIPLGQVATIALEQGPPSIRTENALLSAYIFVDIRERDIGGYVADAQRAVREQVQFPPGYYITWSGQFEYMERAKERLQIVIPLTVLIIFVLLYLNFGRLTETLIVLLSLPFALIGGVWLMAALDYNLSVAVAVGFIALAGVAAETGVVMLVYLDLAWARIKAQRQAAGEAVTMLDLYGAVMEGAVGRVRPKMMTVATTMIGLLPLMWSVGAGSEVMRRIAAPMVGGMISSTVLTLIVIPALYALIKEAEAGKG
jgi:Cu(I)/Ag(I) efflux system membrane protein CusA/SilA